MILKLDDGREIEICPRTRLTGDQRAAVGQACASWYLGYPGHEPETIRDIAEYLGRSYGFVYRLLLEQGIQLRPRGGRRPGGLK